MRIVNYVGILLGLVVILISSPLNIHADGMVSDQYNDDSNDSSEKEQNDNSPVTDTEEESPESEDTGNGSLVLNLIQMVFALFLILVLIYLLLKFLNKRNKLFTQVKALENLGGIAVGPSKSIQIIRVGSKLYLIGVGENVQLLEEIEDEQLRKEILNSYKDQATFRPDNFLSIFQKNSSQDTESSSSNKNDFKNLFSSELEKLKLNRKNLMNKHTEKEDNHE
ncbi:flagellar biosynthetic protein FliO [Ornithinibacillus scapharcae]|uniref:flagellar biosynthetic protein FliO n=1 Tax=Ornithinibacillus scapharcae TaxID=1147159 RepID=UPI000225AA34|nr:flagellar biosynthetic protein FliO [Ornithinibacillus scapharcae]